MATTPVTPAFELHLVHYALHSEYPRGDLLCPIECQLIRVLPEWDVPPATLWAVFPGRRLMPAKTRVFSMR